MSALEISPLGTGRLELLPIKREHAAHMFPMMNEPALYEFTGGSPPVDVESLARLYESWERRTSPDGTEHWFNWVLRLRSSDELVGLVQAGVSPDRATVAWIVGSSWQRQGYAKEAATAVRDWLVQLGVREIRASINPAHTASIKVAEHLGLKQTLENSGDECVWKWVDVPRLCAALLRQVGLRPTEL
jgi:RimJ/RimL family protein N-acetyltransferase